MLWLFVHEGENIYDNRHEKKSDETHRQYSNTVLALGASETG